VQSSIFLLCRQFFISLSNQVPLLCPFVSNLFSCCPYSVFYVSPLWFHVSLTGFVFSFNIISYKYAVLIQTAIFWNIVHLRSLRSYNYKIYNSCAFLRTSQFTGKYCSLSENISVQRPFTFSIHMIDRTLHNLSCWDNYPICTDRRHSNVKNTLYKTFDFLPFTNGPSKLILTGKPVHLLKKSATVYSNLERTYFQNVFFPQLHEHCNR
jgi:hypothetical protein